MRSFLYWGLERTSCLQSKSDIKSSRNKTFERDVPITFRMNNFTHNEGLNEDEGRECLKIFLALPFSYTQIPSQPSLIANATTYEQVINNQLISDATSRFMELYRALQAMIHFNQRNNEVVSNLKEYINNTCPNLHVSQADVSPSENALSYVFNQQPTTTRIDLPSGFNNSVCSNKNKEYSIVGPMDTSSEVGMVADIADSHGTLQITPYSFFEKTSELNGFGRSTTDAKKLATNFVHYLRYLKRDYIALLSDQNCDFSKEVAGRIKNEIGNLTVSQFPYSCNDDDIISPHHCSKVFEEVKATKFSTIVLVEGKDYPQYMDQVISYSIENGLSSSEHLWIIIPHEWNDDCYLYRSLKCFPRDSKEEQFVRGISIYDYRRRFIDRPNTFVEQIMSDFDADVMSLAQSVSLEHFNKMDLHGLLSKKLFVNSAYVYDSTIALLLALCTKNSEAYHSFEKISALIPTFYGSTGNFSLDDHGNRLYSEYSIANLDNDTCSSGISNFHTFNVYANESWNSIADGVYFDGTSNAPKLLRLVHEDMNYISQANFWKTLLVVTFILASCSYLSYLVERYKNKRAIQLAQPFYLHSICFSCALFSLYYVAFAFDENNVPFKTHTLDMFCVMMPIVRSIGLLFTLYSVFIKVKKFS